ncbi:hypothetical protein [Burkholderia ubonensis]|nr:hypothetical protein [Burkholderia ubonensis]
MEDRQIAGTTFHPLAKCAFDFDERQAVAALLPIFHAWLPHALQ